jgi:hypothetical protein
LNEYNGKNKINRKIDHVKRLSKRSLAVFLAVFSRHRPLNRLPVSAQPVLSEIMTFIQSLSDAGATERPLENLNFNLGNSKFYEIRESNIPTRNPAFFRHPNKTPH